MPGPNLPDIPASLKGMQHYLKIATEHDNRDPVVSYWARIYALQIGLKLSTKTSEETNFLLKLMDWLEATKKAMHDNEAITNDVAAQAHLENWALKLFLYADKNDRASNFGKSVVQSFYTAGILYDILTTFGDLSEEATQNRKYAKWKAAYIHNCLKTGETPIPGPMKEEGEDDSEILPQSADDPILSDNEGVVPDEEQATKDNKEPQQDLEEEVGNPESAEELHPDPDTELADDEEKSEGSVQPTPPPSTDAFQFPSVPSSSNSSITTPSAKPNQNNFPYPNIPTPMNPNPYNPAPTPTNAGLDQPAGFGSYDDSSTLKTESGVSLDVEQIAKAQKYVKWAGSALNYDDVPTAVTNIRKALHLLTTGQDIA
ncbi:vacuolar protein sorting-associated protein VTA1 homolog isoform X1 [Orussus abietinus]|uniref:vacuolar protein sorting-associated protein VTA1 homolog isoform X1 n=1 Tax=Orussus abietinus TaxID=222816 RepID=UPI0006268ED0|nr:vacuolar protein sorting-associated protein VTA1 homolog isoform X1 [Orussus abietinus]